MISVLCPSRGRPGFARELLDSMRATENLNSNELILRLDDDDPKLQAYYEQVSGSDVSFVVGPRVVLSQCWNEAYEKARFDVAMLCGDDIRFRTMNWDEVVLWEFEQYPDRLLLVHGRDGIQDDRVATHPFLHRKWVDTVGYFVPPLFASDYNDLWLTEVADQVQRRKYLPELYTEHMHPVAGKAPMDQTHLERLERHRNEDCDGLYARTSDQRALAAGKLWSVINSPQEG